MKKALGLSLVVAMGLTGCVFTQSGSRMTPLERLHMRVGESLAAGQTNEIFNLLEKGLKDPALAGERAEVFREILVRYLMAGEVQVAQQRYLAAAQDVTLGTGGFGLIERHLMQTGQTEALSKWCVSLLDVKLPERTRVNLLGILMDSYRGTGRFDEIKAMIPRIMSEFSPAGYRGLLSGMLDALLAGKQIPAVEELLAEIQSRHGAAAEIPALLAVYRVRVPLVARDAKKVRDAFLMSLATLPDAAAAELFGQILALYRETRAMADADSFCSGLLDHAQAGTLLRVRALKEGVAVAREMGKPEWVVKRMQDAIHRDVPLDVKLLMLRHSLYFVMETGDEAIRESMLRICRTLRKQSLGTSEQTELDTLILDACFLAGDFDLAHALVTAGIEGMDEVWKETLLLKIQAHQALKMGKDREAADLFRRFTDKIAILDANRVEAQDPSTGLRVTKEEVLGLNAARIAGILSKMGQKDKARECMAEAKGHYQKALALFSADAPEYKALQEKISKLN